MSPRRRPIFLLTAVGFLCFVTLSCLLRLDFLPRSVGLFRERSDCQDLNDLKNYCACLKRGGGPSLSEFEFREVQVEDLKFGINTYRENDIVSKTIRLENKWELETSTLLISDMQEHYDHLHAEDPTIEKKDVKFLDIGANIGWYSVLIAASGFGVIAVEPMATNLIGFKDSICRNNVEHLITIHETALAEEHKVCKLYSIVDNVGDGTIACGSDWSSSDSAHPEYVFRQNVTFSRLDDLITDTHSIGVVKMDVEGYEAHVVKGGEKTLLEGGIPKITSEVSSWLMHDAGSDPVDFLNMFYQAGYVIHDLQSTDKPVIPKKKFAAYTKRTTTGKPGDVYMELVKT